jgi:hypothetical protein
MADKELEKANKGYKQHYEDEAKQNAEDRDLIPRIGRKLKEAGKFIKDKVLVSDTEAYRQYDEAERNKRQKKDAAAQEAQQKQMRDAIGADAIEDAMRNGRPAKKKSGGKISSYKSGGMVGSASKRADGCAVKGKTKGRIV